MKRNVLVSMEYRIIVIIFMYINQISMDKNSIKDLPENFKHCRYSDICNRTESEILEKANGKVPCCSSCSCHEDCGLDLNCCFDHLDKYKLTDSGRIGCLTPTLGRVRNELHLYGYYMVQQCDKESSEISGTDHQCYLTDEFGISLIAPVSSLDDNMIYVNKNCAACNKVDMKKIQRWNYFFITDSVRSKTDLMSGIEQYAENQFGKIVYIPPNGQDWSHKHCYNNFIEIKTCKNNSNWLEMCHSLRAPFYYSLHRIYKNAVCLLCTDIQYESVKSVCNFDSNRDPSSTSFSFLLDSSFGSVSKMRNSKTLKKNLQISETCHTDKQHPEEKDCLPIYCPEGMMKIDNDCKYFALKWFIPVIKMQVELHPITESKLSVSTLHSLGDKQRARPLTWLRIPCKQIKATTFKISYWIDSRQLNTTDKNTGDVMSSLQVIIYKMVDISKGINPSIVIPIYHRCLREKWKVVISNVTVKFNAYFSKGKEKRFLENQIKKSEAIPQRDTLIYFTEGPVKFSETRARNLFSLTKPFFCKQVRIPQSDVEVIRDGIHIKSRHLTLGLNEYIVKRTVLPGDPRSTETNTTYAVCIDDFYPNIATIPIFPFISLKLLLLFVSYAMTL